MADKITKAQFESEVKQLLKDSHPTWTHIQDAYRPLAPELVQVSDFVPINNVEGRDWSLWASDNSVDGRYRIHLSERLPGNKGQPLQDTVLVQSSKGGDLLVCGKSATYDDIEIIFILLRFIQQQHPLSESMVHELLSP